MSKRRQTWDIVIKKAGAGFIGEPLIIQLSESFEHCLLNCGDSHCKEWTNCEMIIDNKPSNKYCYHVSECEMEDL